MNQRTSKISQVATAILSLWLSAPCAPLSAQTKDTGTLTVRVTGARNTKGKIGVTLFHDAQGFPDDTPGASPSRRQALYIKDAGGKNMSQENSKAVSVRGIENGSNGYTLGRIDVSSDCGGSIAEACREGRT